MNSPKLSIIIPCYNEEATITTLLERVMAVSLDKEIIVVDDCSRDRTWELLQRVAAQHPLVLVRHERNQGKGAAIRSGLARASGEVTIIQDADLEYNPRDYYALVEPIARGDVDVVFGSRFMGNHTGLYFWNAVGNKVLTFITNFLFNCWISDMETGYKVMRTDVFRSLELESNDFQIEPEIAAKLLRRGYRVYEVPISYMGRRYEEGKKIKPSDGLKAIQALVRYRLQRDTARPLPATLRLSEPAVAVPDAVPLREREVGGRE
jgi:glycosyltransferase involved in cell wall biosynthesis